MKCSFRSTFALSSGVLAFASCNAKAMLSSLFIMCCGDHSSVLPVCKTQGAERHVTYAKCLQSRNTLGHDRNTPAAHTSLHASCAG